MEARGSTKQPPTRREEFWFSNRMIVVKAEDTLFQVHADALTRHSEVFRDLLVLAVYVIGRSC